MFRGLYPRTPTSGRGRERGKEEREGGKGKGGEDKREGRGREGYFFRRDPQLLNRGCALVIRYGAQTLEVYSRTGLTYACSHGRSHRGSSAPSSSL